MEPAMLTAEAVLFYELVVRALVVGIVLGFAGIAALIWKD
jgi:hypothetical protein